jgi:hypothetical protein
MEMLNGEIETVKAECTWVNMDITKHGRLRYIFGHLTINI